jgi:hypothetical protein
MLLLLAKISNLPTILSNSSNSCIQAREVLVFLISNLTSPSGMKGTLVNSKTIPNSTLHWKDLQEPLVAEELATNNKI